MNRSSSYIIDEDTAALSTPASSGVWMVFSLRTGVRYIWHKKTSYSQNGQGYSVSGTHIGTYLVVPY